MSPISLMNLKLALDTGRRLCYVTQNTLAFSLNSPDPRLVASPEATAPQGGIRFLREAFFIWESLTLRVLHLGN